MGENIPCKNCIQIAHFGRALLPARSGEAGPRFRRDAGPAFRMDGGV
jgi:hypothetical protein